MSLMVIRPSIILIALIFFAPLGSSQNLTSTFDLGDEGWSSVGGANVSWMERGGNPGGFLLGEDADENSTWRYVSPKSWSGNWTPYIDDSLSFDIRLIDDDDGFNLNFDDILMIYALNGTFVAWPGSRVPWPGEPERGVWTHYEIALTPDSFGVNESDFLEVMEQVDNISIRGEYSDGRDLEGLDNVMVTPPRNDTADRPTIVHHEGDDLTVELEIPPGTSLESVEPEPFYRRETTVTSGICNKGGSGDGSSSSRIEDERIMLYCEDTGFGTHWASGAVWDEFVYDGDDHLNKIDLKCHIKGGIAVAGVPGVSKNSADLKVYMILYDKTEDFLVDKVPIYSTAAKDESYLDQHIDEWPMGEMEAELMKGHVYQVKLEAVASSSTMGLSSLIVGFSSSDEGIFWLYDQVKWI